MGKSIAIYFSSPEGMGYPFDIPEFFETYIELIDRLEARGINVYIVRDDSYLGSGLFACGWQFKEGALVKIDEEISVDLIFNRDDKNTIPEIHDCKIINQPELDNICTDKLLTVKYFSEISPHTQIIHSHTELEEVLNSWDTKPNEYVVLKKNYESSGRGVNILKAEEVEEYLYLNWADVLVQEFVDSSIGIPGVIEGLHDLRVNVVNGKIVNAFLRKPAEGMLLANVAQGGHILTCDIEKVPSEVIEMTKSIADKFSDFSPSLFAADFMNSPKGFKLIELNSRPGVQHPRWFKDYDKFNEALEELLITAIK